MSLIDDLKKKYGVGDSTTTTTPGVSRTSPSPASASGSIAQKYGISVPSHSNPSTTAQSSAQTGARTSAGSASNVSTGGVVQPRNTSSAAENKYANLRSQPDYAKLSKTIDESKGNAFGITVGNKFYGIGDDVYAYINNINGAQTQADAERSAGAMHMYAFMTQDQKDDYNYLYQSQGKNAANEYLDYIAGDLNDASFDYVLNTTEATMRQKDYDSKIEEVLGGASKVAANIASVPLRVASGLGVLDVLAQKAGNAISGEDTPVDYNATLGLKAATLSNTIRSSTKQNIDDAAGTINLNPEKHPVLSRALNGMGLGTLYNFGMGVLDSTAAVGLGVSLELGRYGGFILGTAAGTQGMLDALSRGANDNQAATMGLLYATFGTLLNSVSIGHLLENPSRSLIKNILSQGKEEMAEEVLEFAADTLSDILVMGDKSEFKRKIGKNIADGDTEKEAFWDAVIDTMIELGWDGLAGFVSGGLMGGLKYAYNSQFDPWTEGDGYTGETGISTVVDGNPSPYIDVNVPLVPGEASSGRTGKVTANIDNQMQLMQKNASSDLRMRGETGDVDTVASAVAKRTLGIALTAEEKNALVQSRYGVELAAEYTSKSTAREGTAIATAEDTKGVEKSMTAKGRTDLQSARALQPSQMSPTMEPTQATSGNSAGVSTSEALESAAEIYGKQAAAFKSTYALNPTADVNSYALAYDYIWNAGRTDSLTVSQLYRNQRLSSVLSLDQIRQIYNIGKDSAGTPIETSYGNKVGLPSSEKPHHSGRVRLKGMTANDMKSILSSESQPDKVKALVYHLAAATAEATGIDVDIYDSAISGSETGVFAAPEGYAIADDLRIGIDLSSGINKISDIGDIGKMTALRVFPHEFGHIMRKMGGDAYDEYVAIVKDEYNKRLAANNDSDMPAPTFDDLVDEAMERWNRGIDRQNSVYGTHDPHLTRAKAEEEVICESMTEMLPQSDFAKAVYSRSKRVFDALVKSLNELLDKIKAYFKRLGVSAKKEATILMDQINEELRYVSSVVEAYNKLIDTTIENIQAHFAETGYDGTNMSNKSGVENYQAAMVETESAEDADITDLTTETTAVENVVQNSVRSLAEAGGFRAEQDAYGNIILTRDGSRVSEVTVDDIDNSPIGALINHSLESKYIDAKTAASQKKLFADLLTMAAKSNDLPMAMQFAGSSIFTAIKSNSDKQYNTTYDFPSICTKTQAVIDSMSAAMKAKKAGLTKSEIEHIYQQVFYDGNPVPCPECYVFSRWVGIGSLLDNIWTYQNKYDGKTAEEVQAQYLAMESVIKETAEKNGLSFGKSRGKLAAQYTKRYKELYKKVTKAENQGEKVNSKDVTELGILQSNMELVKSMTWIDTVYFKNAAHTAVNPRSKWYVPSSVLFDLNEGEAFASSYPQAWGFRTTQGAGYGKAITPYSEAVLGEGIMGTNSINDLMKKKKAGTLNNIFLNQKGTLDTAARKALDKATRKMNNQAFLGGQRFQSTSDARFENAFDYLLAALEVQAMHGMVQVYTKVPGAVPSFAAWGFSTNQSLMPKGGGLNENGVPIDTAVGGMNPRVAQQNRKDFPTQGTITIGVNDNHIRAMMNQLWRDFIIPYHASGGDAKLVSSFRNIQDSGNVDVALSTDYTRTQSDKVLSDDVLRNYYHLNDEQIQLIHDRRQARLDIFAMNLTGKRKASPNMDIVRGSQYLSALYDKLSEGGEWAGVTEPKGIVEGQIFPNEYWDQSVTYENSGKVTQDYLNYCEELGMLHRFSGMVPSNGTLVSVNGYDQNGKRVKLTDLAYNEDGSINDFFWKVLTDRRMYDNDGNYLPQRRVSLGTTQVSDVEQFATAGRYGALAGRQYNAEQSAKTASRLATEFTADQKSKQRVTMQEVSADGAEEAINNQFSVRVTDEDTLDRINAEFKKGEYDPVKNPNGGYIKVYRSVQIIDGGMYAPMNSVDRDEEGKNHKLGYRSVFGQLEMATESPEIAQRYMDKHPDAKYAKFDLDGVDNKTNGVAYNPYIHMSNLVLNDQFAAAYRRNLITIECWVPVSEIGAYKAQYAKDGTGWVEWKPGGVAGKLMKVKPEFTRRLFVSRYSMPVREVPPAEVARMYADYLSGTGIKVPWNVVTPALREELVKAGVGIDYKDVYQSTDKNTGVKKYLKFSDAFPTAAENNTATRTESNKQYEVLQDRSSDYSYKSLIAKPDMEITRMSSVTATNRSDLITDAKKNAASIGKLNQGGFVEVYVDDIGRDVVIGTEGLKHGLRRSRNIQNSDIAIVTLNSGEIIKNSVKVNELVPARNSADSAYVLIGCSFDSAGNFYVVRSLINSFTDTLDSIDVLYAINTKKESAALNAPRFAVNPLSVTDSKIRIADLLGIVNDKFPEVLSMDVLRHFGKEKRPNSEISDSVVYSIRDSSSTAISNRDLLRQAAADVRHDETKYGKLTEGEKSALFIFEARLRKLDAADQQRLDLLEQKRTILNGREAKELTGDEKLKYRRVQNNLDTINAQRNRYNEDLLKVESQKVLQGVLKKARTIAEKEVRRQGTEKLQAYRAQRNETEATRKYRKQIADTAKTLSDWIKVNSDEKHVPTVLRKPLAQLLESIDFSSKRYLNGGELTNADRKFAANITAIKQLVDGQQAVLNGEDENKNSKAVDNLGAYLDLSVENRQFLNDLVDVIAQSGETTFTINRMNAEQLEAFSKFLKNLTTAIRQSNKMLANARYQDLPEMAQSSMKHMDDLGRAKDSAGRRISKFLQWENATPYYAFKRFGDAGKAIFDGFTRGWETFAKNAQEIIQFSEKTWTPKEVRAWRSEIHNITLEDGSKIRMTTAQIMELSQLLNRPQAVQHIEAGGIRIGNIDAGNGKVHQDTTHHHFSANDLSNVVGLLTDRQKEVATEMRKYMGQRGGEWGNEISMARFGYEFYTEGENYYTIKTDATGRPMSDTDNNSNSMFRLLNLSASKSLNPRANNALIVGDIFDTFSDHMADMAKLNALGLPLLDAIKWYNYTERTTNADGTIDQEGVKKAMESAFGTAAGKYFRTLLQDVNGVKEAGDRGGDAVSKLISNYKIAAVAANLRVALLQPTSYVRAQYILKPKYMAQAFLFKKNAYKDAMKYSGTAVWKSLGYYDTDIARSLRSQIENDDSFGDKLKEWSMSLAELGDKRTWGRLWVACKLQVKAENPDLAGEALNQRTADLFRETIYATQVMDSTLTRSEMMRGSTKWTKLTTAFMAEPTLSYNIAMDAASEFELDKRKYNRAEAWRRNSGRIGRAFITYIASAAAAAIVESIADAFRDDDDYETLLEKIKQAFFGDKWYNGNLVEDLSIIGKIPVFKDFLDLLKEGKDDGGGMEMASAVSLLNAFKIWKETYQLSTGALKSATDATWNGKMTTYGKIYKTLQALSQLSGYPAANLTRDMVAMWNTIIGSSTPELKLHTYDPGEKNSIKYAYLDGALTEEEATSALLEKGLAKDANDAYFIVSGWDTGDGKYTALKDAIKAGDSTAYAEALSDLTSHGVNKDTAYSQAKSYIRDLYVGTEKEDPSISKYQAISLLQSYAGAKKDEANDIVAGWSTEIETGFAYNQLSDAYTSGKITYNEFVEYQITYGGKSRSDAIATADKWKFVGSNEEWENISESAVRNYNDYCASAGISKRDYYEAWNAIKSIHGTDKDGDGTNDAYTTIDNKLTYIGRLNLTPTQKTALALASGISDKNIRKRAPW